MQPSEKQTMIGAVCCRKERML